MLPNTRSHGSKAGSIIATIITNQNTTLTA